MVKTHHGGLHGPQTRWPRKGRFVTVTSFLLATLIATAPASPSPAADSVIVQANSLESARTAVESVGGLVTHDLGVIRAVAATLDRDQLERLPSTLKTFSNGRAIGLSGNNGNGGARDKRDRGDSLDGPPTSGTQSMARAAVQSLHDRGLSGAGVTVAVIDSGWYEGTLYGNSRGRMLGHYDAIRDSFDDRWMRTTDSYGHGAHVAGIIAADQRLETSQGDGIALAPGSSLYVVKAFDETGRGTYADVIRGIDRVVADKDQYGIRVLNLSFSAPAQSYYWDDPLNQAVMAAWQAGIVVVASAGNTGPEPMTIGVPGNVPYVITVGAMTDSYTPANPSDDRLASFSSTGPTVEAFVKPDLLAPGGHIVSTMSEFSSIALDHPEYRDSAWQFTMSGTSQSAAFVSAVVALLLESTPSLSPDDVKCRLLAGARPAVNADGSFAYSVFQQGAGLVDAVRANDGLAQGCANAGLDVAADLAGSAHFVGRARLGEDGVYYLVDDAGFLWGDGFLWGNGFLWGDGLPLG